MASAEKSVALHPVQAGQRLLVVLETGSLNGHSPDTGSLYLSLFCTGFPGVHCETASPAGVSGQEENSGVRTAPSHQFSPPGVLGTAWSPMGASLWVGFCTSVSKVSAYSLPGWSARSRTGTFPWFSPHFRVMLCGHPRWLLGTERKLRLLSTGPRDNQEGMGGTLMASLFCPQGLLHTKHCRETAISVVVQGRVCCWGPGRDRL